MQSPGLGSWGTKKFHYLSIGETYICFEKINLSRGSETFSGVKVRLRPLPLLKSHGSLPKSKHNYRKEFNRLQIRE